MKDISTSAPESTWSDRHSKLLGSGLVAGQFGVLFVMATLVQVPWGQTGSLAAGGIGLSLSGVMGMWTLVHNRLGNFNIRPAPKATGHMVTSGPYRWVRHPMYAAVLMLAWVMVMWGTTWAVSLALWTTLAGVLWRKASLEERWMCQQHPGYANYIKQSKRFLPGIF